VNFTIREERKVQLDVIKRKALLAVVAEAEQLECEAAEARRLPPQAI
jgi:hypothetical protein